MTVLHESGIFSEVVEFRCRNVVSIVKCQTLWTDYSRAHFVTTRSGYNTFRNKLTYTDHVDYFRVETLNYSRV